MEYGKEENESSIKYPKMKGEERFSKSKQYSLIEQYEIE